MVLFTYSERKLRPTLSIYNTLCGNAYILRSDSDLFIGKLYSHFVKTHGAHYKYEPWLKNNLRNMKDHPMPIDSLPSARYWTYKDGKKEQFSRAK